jgi:hypothetical protein
MSVEHLSVHDIEQGSPANPGSRCHSRTSKHSVCKTAVKDVGNEKLEEKRVEQNAGPSGLMMFSHTCEFPAALNKLVILTIC